MAAAGFRFGMVFYGVVLVMLVLCNTGKSVFGILSLVFCINELHWGDGTSNLQNVTNTSITCSNSDVES